MFIDASRLIFIGAAFLFGIRHGIDWDHIAAISSLTGATPKEKQFLTNLLYISGHAIVVVVLGLFSIQLGITLPQWIDLVMEPIVGLTLIFLGGYLLFILFYAKKVRLMSRWMFLYHFFNKIKHSIGKQMGKEEAATVSHNKEKKQSSKNHAFVIGMIHGIGAETPTQLLLFLTIVGVSGKGNGLILLLFFLSGLFLSHILLCFSIMFGYEKVQKRVFLYKSFGFVFGVINIGVGLLFIFR